MIRKATTTAVLLAAGILATAGCSSSGDDAGKGSSAGSGSTDAMLKVARDYQEAVNRSDWHTVCSLSSSALQNGSIQQCVERFGTDDETATPEESPSPSPTVSPPQYIGRSTPEPEPTATPSGDDHSQVTKVTTSDVVTVEAAEDHPAGYGVLASFTVTWPGEETDVDRVALRLVQQRGTWVVDQDEDVQDSDYGHGSPVPTALYGG